MNRAALLVACVILGCGRGRAASASGRWQAQGVDIVLVESHDTIDGGHISGTATVDGADIGMVRGEISSGHLSLYAEHHPISIFADFTGDDTLAGSLCVAGGCRDFEANRNK